MNKKNNILIFSLLLILFISISAISAADTNIDNTSNNEKLKATTVKDTTAHTKYNTANVKDKLKDGKTKSFRALEQKISGSGVLDLDFDVSYKSGDSKILIRSSMTINGKGHTIDAKNKIRIFNVCSGCTLTLSNVNIKNGFASGSDGKGGAILNSGNLKLTNCTFTNCNVKGSKSEGGAISGAGSATIVKCTFDQCSAGDKAGAVRGEKLTIKSCTFKKCSAPNMGGAIFGNKNKILKCNFNGCAAGYGGAIGGTPDRIADSNFKNCKATKSGKDGGGACSGDFPRIESCTFTNCKAEKGFGGAIRGTTHTYNCNFTDCVAKQGGAIRGKGKTINCIFENCKATKDMGGGIFTEHSTIKKCTFIKCSAKTYGGGIYAGQDVKIEKKTTKFIKCSGKKGKKGDARIYGNYQPI